MLLCLFSCILALVMGQAVITSDTFFSELFSEEGILAKTLTGYEHRHEQEEMAREIWEAFERGESPLIEAGTGIGKSMAYLVASLYWSVQTGEKIVISTYTIALQQQLIEKDLPCLLDALGIDLRIVLAKGMSNYVCLRKLDDLEKETSLLGDEDRTSALIEWARTTRDGTRSALPFSPKQDLWKKSCAESEACPYLKCPHYKKCHFFGARSDLAEADVMVVNHHLLMAHLLADEKQPLLPPFSRIVIDEAHHLPAVARHALCESVDRVSLFKTMARIHTDSSPETSRFFFLRDQLKEQIGKGLVNQLGLDLPGEKRLLQTQVQTAFDRLDAHYMGKRNPKARLTPDLQKGETWTEQIVPSMESVAGALRKYSVSLTSMEKELRPFAEGEQAKGIDSALFDIASAAVRLKERADLIDQMLKEPKEEEVRWVEQKETGCLLTLAKLDVSEFLKERLFDQVKSAVLTSATLTTQGSFSHLIDQVGMAEVSKREKIYPSPFDYQNRTRFMVPSDLPPPNAFDFMKEAVGVIEDALNASKGGAFILFTSYEMMHACAGALDVRYPLFVQGDLPRNQLVEAFKETNNGVLLGADSFWEGIDVAGEALRLVIITKLPFPVPTDPLVQARAEQLQKENKNPFMEDSLPHAVLKFKQGFGRLMRTKQDRGAVLCLDTRLAAKAYGKHFLQSLPECLTTLGTKKEVQQDLLNFFRSGA